MKLKNLNSARNKNFGYIKVFSLFGIITAVAVLSNAGKETHAQIVPDETLREGERSRVRNTQVSGDRADLIHNGARRRGNLFHSFSEFNVNNNQRVYFASPEGIESIFSRVTGDNVSEIMGTLGVDGSANLFFLNPNGIIFGANSSLDIAGSFVATTANRFRFERLQARNGKYVFSAENPEAVPPMLRIRSNSTDFLFGANPPGAILSRSENLEVDFNQNLFLVGGTVALEGRVQGGRVGLAAVPARGQVIFNRDEANVLGVDYSKSDIAEILELRELTDVQFQLNAEGQLLLNGNNAPLGAVFLVGSQAGIRHHVGNDSQDTPEGESIAENGTAIEVWADSLFMADGAQIESINSSNQNGGRIVLQIRDRTFLADSPESSNSGGFNTGIFSRVQGNSSGSGSDINITSREISISGNNAGIQSRVAGTEESTSLDSEITEETSRGGRILIGARTLRLDDGGSIETVTDNSQNAGNIRIQGRGNPVRDNQRRNRVMLDDGRITSFVSAHSSGRGGDIRIRANRLRIQNGGLIETMTQGAAAPSDLSESEDTADPIIERGGNIEVVARRVVLQGGRIESSAESEQDAGSINITTVGNIAGDNRIILRSSEDSDSNENPFGIFSAVRAEALGQGGGIRLTTNRLNLHNGAQIISHLESINGDISLENSLSEVVSRGGDINISAEVITNGNGEIVSLASGSVDARGGDIAIQARRSESISLDGGNQIFTEASDSAERGDIIIRNANRVHLNNGQVIGGEGSSTIRILRTVQNLDLVEGSLLTADNIDINIGRNLILMDSSQLDAENIDINARRDLALMGGSQIDAERIDIDTGRDLMLMGSSQLDSENIDINARRDLMLMDSSQIDSENVDINTGRDLMSVRGSQIEGSRIEIESENLHLGNAGIISEDGQEGALIILDILEKIILGNGSLIRANSTGPSGNILIQAEFLIARTGNQDSDIIAFSSNPLGGDITLDVSLRNGIEERPQLTSMNDIVASGEIDVRDSVVLDQITLDNLQTDFVDTSIAQSCSTNTDSETSESQFVMIGRGGFSPSPYSELSSTHFLDDLGNSTMYDDQPLDERANESYLSRLSDEPVVEANGWITSSSGNIILIADASSPIPYEGLLRTIPCD